MFKKSWRVEEEALLDELGLLPELEADDSWEDLRQEVDALEDFLSVQNRRRAEDEAVIRRIERASGRGGVR